MILDAYWLVYPVPYKTEREREEEEKERQMLFKKYNPRVCDGVCGSAVCLSTRRNSVWQLH